MKTKKVLIVSHAEDGSSKLLMQRLKESDEPYQLVDLGKFPLEATASIDLSSEVSMRFVEDKFGFTGDSVKSVWWRRPKGKARPSTNNPLQRYIELESEVFISSLFNLLGTDTQWVSHPEKTRLANRKPLQLEVARQIGFRIPKTLVSNDPEAVRDFLEVNHNMPIIMKPVGTSFVRLSDDPTDAEGKNLAIYTKIVDKDLLLRNIQKVKNCPVIFQEAAMQEFDIRVTVVGRKVFAVKISHSKEREINDGNLDWRHHELDRVYEKYQLPSELENKCVEIVNRLGLNFGAIDMCFSKEKGYIFFEINPQGQWVPSEVTAGHPISIALAEFLSM
ncbi:MAG: hypothetical protein HYV67_01085 [Candidatus Taylorbacteria bacterium]|nr:hypothetical protein [Candidatus Taylorbacteria bacterium]